MLIPFELYAFMYFSAADTCMNGSSDPWGKKWQWSLVSSRNFKEKWRNPKSILDVLLV